MGHSGGIVVIWNNSLDVSLTSFSFNHISMDIHDAIRGLWRLTAFYGFPERSRNHLS